MLKILLRVYAQFTKCPYIAIESKNFPYLDKFSIFGGFLPENPILGHFQGPPDRKVRQVGQKSYN